jgi:actin beta/gamma 1
MDFYHPVVKGEIVDWNKYETLFHHLLYNELKVVPEEISVLITESPLNPKKNRAKLAETLFETFNVQKIHIANSSMLSLYSYGITSGIVVDSGYGITTCVPIYEGYPLPQASSKINFGGENLSNLLLTMIQSQLNMKSPIKGRLCADRIKEAHGYVCRNFDEEENNLSGENKEIEYTLPDNTTIKMGSELYRFSESIFRPQDDSYSNLIQMITDSTSKCDPDITDEIQSNICLSGGTTLMNGYAERIQNDLVQKKGNSTFVLNFSPERQYSSWIGGSIISSLTNFNNMWVTKQYYDDVGNSLEAVDSMCF